MRAKLWLVLIIFLIVSTSFAADNLKDMFGKGSVNGEIRYRNFNRNFDDSSLDRSDSAFGGMLYYKTDSLYGVSFGVSFLVSEDVNSDDDKVVYGLLDKDEEGNHKGFNKLGEYYVKGEWLDTTIKIGSQEINTPFANKYDFRMTPNVYRGVSVINKSVQGLELQGYYLTDFQKYSASEYSPISEAFSSVVEEDDKPLIIAGVKYTLPSSVIDKLSVQLWTYNMPDVYMLNYVRADYRKQINDIYAYNLRLSYLTQDDVGDSLAGEIDTEHYGFITGIEAYGFRVDVGYAETTDDNLVIPFGDDVVVSQAPGGSYRAEEDAYLVRVMYDFSHIGLKGLTAYIDHAYYDTPESGENASYDINETDFDVNYALGGVMDGFAVRFRYAYVDTDEDEGGVDHDDIRFYLTYKFALSGK
jgi:hypothetical protein